MFIFFLQQKANTICKLSRRNSVSTRFIRAISDPACTTSTNNTNLINVASNVNVNIEEYDYDERYWLYLPATPPIVVIEEENLASLLFGDSCALILIQVLS